MKFLRKTFNSRPEFLANAAFSTIGKYHARATSDSTGIATEIGDRYIVKTGTPYPANDETCEGLVFQDYDVTDGDANMAIVYEGCVMRAALPVTLTYEAEQALKNITFVGGTAPEPAQQDGT